MSNMSKYYFTKILNKDAVQYNIIQVVTNNRVSIEEEPAIKNFGSYSLNMLLIN